MVPLCPFCESERVARKAENRLVGRWNCHECTNSFNVLSGTIFQGTHIELQKWFLAIALMADAKKSLSSCQLARDLELNQKTAWRMQQCIRSAMTTDEESCCRESLKPTKPTWRETALQEFGQQARPRFPGQNSVAGVVERGGEVKAQVTRDTKGRTLLEFIQKKVEVARSSLVTDHYGAYNRAGELMAPCGHRPPQGYVDPSDKGIHTNTIEGFWALIKRAWYGSHHHYSRRWMPLFIGEACWKYNHRDIDNSFDAFIHGCFK